MRTPTRSRLHLLADCVLMGSALLAAAACGSPSSATPTPTSSATPIPVATYVPTPVTGAIGPLPTDCTPVSPPATLSFPNGLQVGPGGSYTGPVQFDGSSPVWLYDPQVPQRVHVNPYQPPAWPSLKLQFIAGPNYRGTVVIEGQDLHTGRLLWFSATGDFPPPAGTSFVAPLVFDLGNNPHQWADLHAFPFLPSAGCYLLGVTWTAWPGGPAGHWQLTFAFGH
jgi:hypothetical protein